MTRCPRCSASAAPYTRCDRCGLMLGFDGLTILLDCGDSPACRRVRELARRQPSCTEWKRDDGSCYLHVTYSFDEVESFSELAAAAARLPHKRAFVKGLEIRWPKSLDVAAFRGEWGELTRPRDKGRSLAGAAG